MKILFLSDAYLPTIGGGASAVHNLATGILAYGHQVKVLTTTQDANISEEETIDGVPVKRIFVLQKLDRFYANYLSVFNPKIVSYFEHELKDYSPDIVHVHNVNWYFSYYCLRVAKEFGVKVFFTAHDVMSFNYRKVDGRTDQNYKVKWLDQLRVEKLGYFPLRNYLIREYLNKYSDRVICVSEALNNALRQNLIADPVTIYNGVNINLWRTITHKELEDFRKKYDLFGKKVIFFGGRLSEGKGVDVLISALEKISSEYENLVLIIAGDMDECRRVEDKIKAKKIGVGVKLLGPLAQAKMRLPYHSCDLFISPSTCFDSFPTVNLEAMACKKPVVTTIFGGGKEQVVDGKTGYVVDPNDTRLLSTRMSEILKNNKLAKEMGERGYRRVVDRFSLINMVSSHLSLYRGK